MAKEKDGNTADSVRVAKSVRTAENVPRDPEAMTRLREKSMRLPLLPGVYIMKNAKGKIIYIGKAKVLKNRVSQYFGSQNTHTEKVRRMVENVNDFDYILCSSEFEALILECSLIKQNRPKYNILLKDDKGYSYLKITNEAWPRLELARRKESDGAQYLGPYISSFVVTQSLDAARKIFRLPNCSRQFPSGPNSRPCLNYHMGLCTAPCCGKISHEDYLNSVNEAAAFLKGGMKQYLDILEERMEQYSDNMQYERAAEVRDRMAAIRRLSEKQQVISENQDPEDVFALARENDRICFNVLRFSDGMLKSSSSYFTELEDTLEETRAEILKRFYSQHTDIPYKVLLDGICDDADLLTQWLSEQSGRKVTLSVPQKGRPLELVTLSKNNAYEKMAQTHKRAREDAAVIELGELLGLPRPPVYIESYDISHTAGADAVGAMVVFENGVPCRSAYRKFIIQSAVGGDDYGAMTEVLTRRFRNYMEAHETTGGAEKAGGAEKPETGFARLPDIILMDGGLAQVHAAEAVLRQYNLSVPVFGMVKDDRHRTRAIVSDDGETAISPSRKVFQLVTGIQDEVHRFAIGFHHERHAKNARHSQLTDIPGIGPKKSEVLWRTFKTMDAIRRADIDTLARTPGISNADAVNIKKYFHYENG